MSSFSDQDFDRAVAAFRDAPFVEGSIQQALGLLAKAAGGWGAQIIGVSPTLGLTFQWHSGFTSSQITAWSSAGGSSPAVNTRLATLLEQPLGVVVADHEIISPEERSSSPLYQDLFTRLDCPYGVAARLHGTGDVRVLVAALRSSKQGPAGPEDKQQMQALLPHVEGALRVQTALEGQGALMAVRSFEALSMAALLCNAWGRVVGLTPAAERLIQRGRPLRLSGGQLTAGDGASNMALQNALRAACSDGAAEDLASRGSLVFTDADGGTRRVDIAPLPLQGAPLRLGAVAVVAISDTLPQPKTTELLRRTFGLTKAEAEVAMDVADGLSAKDIGDRRGVSASTVRVQVQAVLQKTGLRKTSALASLVVRLASV